MFKRVFVSLIVAAGLVAGGAAAQTAANSLAKIKAAKAINVAYSADSLPFSFNGANNEPAGYSIDLCKRVIAQIGRAVGEPNLKVNWLAGSVTERLQMVASGRAELECANTTQTQSRLANVDFSNLIFIDGGGFLVKAGAPINQIPDLAGKKVAVLKGTTTETRLNDMLPPRLVNATVVPITDANEGVAMLESGAWMPTRATRSSSSGWPVLAKDPAKLALLAEELSFEPYAMALPRNDSALRLEVNKALTQVYMSGDIEAIFAQWLGKLGPPSRAARGHVPAEFDSRMNRSNRRMRMTSMFQDGGAVAAVLRLCRDGAGRLQHAARVPGQEQPSWRVGTVESITQDSVQNVNTTVGTIGGALIGGGLGSLIGGGTGQIVATVVGAVGGGFAGNQLAQRSQTLVWRIGVRYDDGSLATVQQTSAPALRIGDRVRVTGTGIELLR